MEAPTKILSKHSVSELKELLKAAGLPVSGKKEELIKRLEEKDTASPNKRKLSGSITDGDSKAKKKKSEVEDEEDDEEGHTNDSQGSGAILVLEPTDFTQPLVAEDDYKIVTFNVAGLRAMEKKGFDKYLADENPTIICLNETKVDEKAYPENKYAGYYSYFYSPTDKPGYSGTAIITKVKPISVVKGIGHKEHDNEGRVITAEFKNFYLVASYIPNSGKKDPNQKGNPWPKNLDYRMEWDAKFQFYLQELDKKKPVLWCGDLNVAHKEIDLKNPKTNLKNAGFTLKERDSFTAFLNSGFVDLYRERLPNETDCYTFWSFFRNARAKGIGWRLDYFVSSIRFSEKVPVVYRRNNIPGSDHCPLVVHVKKSEFE